MRPTLSTLLLAAVLVAVASAGAAADPPLPPWKEAYLAGLEHEATHQWGLASAAFERARVLRPEPESGVDFGARGPLDYDPYLHLARCALQSGRSPLAVRRLLERSARAGVTPREELERLAAQGRERFGPPPQNLPREPPPDQEAPPPPDRSPTPGRSSLSLAGHPAGAVVTVDGVAYPPNTGTIQLDPGAHRVAVGVGGALLLETSIDLGPGQLLVLAVPTPPPPTLAPSPAEAAAATPFAEPARSRSAPPTLLWVVGVAGGSALLLWLALRLRRSAVAPELAPTQRLEVGPPGTLIGHTLGGYLVERRLGSGGMATTYRAQRSSDGKPVALKVPHEQHLHDLAFRTRFLREGQLGTQLHHPNIVRVLEAGEESDRPFIAMELVDGRTLRDLIVTAGEMPLDRALDITRQVAEALDYAHAKGVTHRDLKPENLMVDRSGAVRVMDFGLARLSDAPGLTASSVFLGTPAYAAPEAISGMSTDHRQDLYALGLVLFELLQGRAPHAGSSPLEQLRSHLDGRFPRREELDRPLPDPVWDLIQALVARDPADRPAHAEQVLVRLRDLLRRAEEGHLE